MREGVIHLYLSCPVSLINAIYKRTDNSKSMKNIRYSFMVLLGGTLYGTMSSLVKRSYAHGFTAAELSFWQAFVAAIILAISAWISSKGNNGRLHRYGVLPLLLTGSAIGLTNFLYYKSVQFIPASLAIILLMQFTWFSILLEWIFLRRRPTRTELVTVTVILIGTIMASGIMSTDISSFSIIGVGLALLSSLTYAAYIVANGQCGRSVRWEAKSMAIMAGSSLTIFAINAPRITGGEYICGEFVLWIVVLAVAGTTIPTALFAAGIPKIGAPLSSILMTVELPVAVICAWLILGERMSTIQIVGVILLLTAIAVMNHSKQTTISKSTER